jgi:hypothetical protein
MSFWSILWWPLGAFAAYLAACFIVGFLGAVGKELGIRRKPKFRVIRYEEAE